MASINIQYLKADILRSKNQFAGLAKGAATSKVNAAKIALIEDLEDHVVTQELKQGPFSDGKILEEGNLYAFIGFNNGTDPVEPLKELLVNTIAIKNPSSNFPAARLQFDFPVVEPTAKQIATATPMPNWASGSWVTRVERGVKGLESFLYGMFRTSRSGGGIQIKGKVRNDRFTGIPYLTPLLTKFRLRVTR